jgi:hypothetical protein
MLVTVPGIIPTLLSVIMAQATVVLIACSIVLSLQRDLYEDDRGRGRRPLLASAGAQRLRWFLRWFVIGLALYYLVLALAVGLIEFSPNNSDQLLDLTSSRLAIHISLTLQDVYVYATRAHFIIVVLIALIVGCTARVRHQEAERRWTPAGA